MNPTTPLVSVMIPTYNQEKYITTAIQSALDQTYPNIEIVVSDDSENNHTETIINTNFFNKVRYFHNEKSKGRVGNYHYMLNHLVHGEWVVNLDGDDYFIDKDFITKAITLIKKFPSVGFVFSKQIIYNIADNKKIYSNSSHLQKEIIEGNWLFLNTTFKNIEIPHLGTLYNKSRAINLDFYNSNRISSDRESLLKLCLNNKVGFLNSDTGVWVHHDHNASQKICIKDFFDNIQMYDDLFNFALKYSKINLFKLIIWKIISKYKSIFSQVILFLSKQQYHDLKRMLKIVIFKEPFFFLLLLLDLRFLKKVIYK